MTTNKLIASIQCLTSLGLHSLLEIFTYRTPTPTPLIMFNVWNQSIRTGSIRHYQAIVTARRRSIWNVQIQDQVSTTITSVIVA